MKMRLVFAGLFFIASCLPALAVDVPEEGQKILEKPATAYRSKTFNRLLMACGVQELTPDAVEGVPKSYAKTVEGNVKFNNSNMVYPPHKYHAILTAYGLQISPEEVEKRMGYLDYAKVKDGEVVFGKTSTAYNRKEWVTILACYTSGETMSSGIGDRDGDGVNDDKDACPNTPKGVAVDERGCWSEAAKFLFALDSAELSSEAKSVLNKVQGIFDENPGLTVRIDGHTCDLGSNAYNKKLSERRAQTVVDYLVNEVGINVRRLQTKGYGESRPAYPNDSETNRAKNRRVEFTPVK